MVPGKASELAAYHKAFVYLTFIHSEALQDQEVGVVVAWEGGLVRCGEWKGNQLQAVCM